METKNLGVLIAPPRPQDWKLGGVGSFSIDRLIKDWSIYLPADESQRNKATDFLECVSMSMLHDLEMQLNYLLMTKQLPDEALNFFTNNNYLLNGSFELSARFNAKMNGTDKTMGQYLNVAADSLRATGFIPKSDWDMTDTMSFADYYGPIPSALLVKAKKVFWFIAVNNQWVNKSDFASIFPVSPVQVATEICDGWDSGQPVQKCSNQALQHATVLYGTDVLGNYEDLDHYPPYKQKLAPDFEFPVNMQYVVTVKPLALRNGMIGTNVLQMQKDLNRLGSSLKMDGEFGNFTKLAVMTFQTKYGLAPDGIAGPLTLGKIKSLVAAIIPRTLLDAIIKVESGGDDYAEGDKNLPDHAYGCLQIRQGVCDAVNSHFDTNFKAQDCLGNRSVSLAIWNKYWLVYPLLSSEEERARAWNGGPGWKQIYFLANKTPEQLSYCKNLDIYWSKVKLLLGK